MIEKNGNRSRDEAIEKIEYYIIENKLAPHSKIPSERDLCDMWNFNRSTLRSAIQRLVVEGKLYQKKGSGTYVAKPKLIRNLQELRSLSREVMDNGQSIESKVLSAEIIESNKQTTKKLHLPLGHSVYALTRIRYIDDDPVTIESSFIDGERFKELKIHDFSKESLYAVLEEQYNIEIMKGEERVGIAYATEYEAELLNIEPGQAVFYLTGVVYEEDGSPIEYFKSIVRSDKIRFSSILTKREDG
ncbi:GntR family transcriptional regulator [Clostridium manihotivorum]|uniref:GntR family transcriptional regulator n=1 Tax=Clostridium manihotivorum TaxID=2320868 RepID=A0A410DWA8_9CLOT|nr:GntR family transcriptional regulator [Clostridium manihotivorum]QAA33436.1 GntR family transcriptional regulator [Clostridium manihotivorum]